MSDETNTLDDLWQKLGLDSLPADAGAHEDLRATRSIDWSAATVRAARETLPERTDLPRISGQPPKGDDGAPASDLVVVGLLGEGGMGRVLLSRQQSLGRDVAVKVARADASPGVVQALVHEARTTGALEHPGVIPVYALATDVDGRPALVMKRVDGVAWSRLLTDEKDPAWEQLTHRGADALERHVDILVHVCNAIAYAHSKGILHRDIKPANVLIGGFGEVFVADWGVATRKSQQAAVPRKPALIGTPVYMAPEMLTGDDARMDERTDVFLLGATLFEVLAGQPPFLGSDLRDALQRAFDHRRHPLPPSAPGDLVEICDLAMAPAPAARFQTVIELRDALVGWVRHRGSVSLARASHERLDQLLVAMRDGAQDRAVIVPLLSECRFGFGQALREWPGNELAREGLRDSIEAAARFETRQGNLQAARALCAELAEVPKDLVASLAELEATARVTAAREARFLKLEKEMDPLVSRWERGTFFLVMAIATVILVATSRYSALGQEVMRALGPFFPAALMTGFLVAYIVALGVGRKSLLATRLNRRVAGVVGLAIVGPLVNRLAAAFSGATRTQTLVSDMVLTATMTTAAGFMLHRSFLGPTVTYLLGAAAAIVWPEAASSLHVGVSVVSLAIVAATWGRWRNELGLTPRGPK